jgi:hypothetical protein
LAAAEPASATLLPPLLASQQSFASLQQSLPAGAAQHSGALSQQALFSLQQARLLSQQPDFFAAWQQSFFDSQQASFSSQQFLAFVVASAAQRPAAAKAPTATKPAATDF